MKKNVVLLSSYFLAQLATSLFRIRKPQSCPASLPHVSQVAILAESPLLLGCEEDSPARLRVSPASCQ